MKKPLIILVLLFSSSVLSEDISDFQIEGMSVGDSALDYFSEKEIEQNLTNYYDYHPIKDFHSADFYKQSSFKTYDSVEIFFRVNDRQYIIQGMGGAIFYDNNIEDCYDKRERIVEELKNIFVNAKITGPETFIHDGDKTGKSNYLGTWFWFERGASQVACYDWSNAVTYTDHLLVSIYIKEIDDWLSSY